MFEQGDQLLATIAAQGRRIGKPLLPQRSTTAQHHITDAMAIAVIDALEIVEIDQRQHERPPLAVQLPEPFIQEASIVKAGQRIPVGRIV
ncbi:hypothetical protein D3C79_541910 [compost metagenome]